MISSPPKEKSISISSEYSPALISDACIGGEFRRDLNLFNREVLEGRGTTKPDVPRICSAFDTYDGGYDGTCPGAALLPDANENLDLPMAITDCPSEPATTSWR